MFSQSAPRDDPCFCLVCPRRAEHPRNSYSSTQLKLVFAIIGAGVGKVSRDSSALWRHNSGSRCWRALGGALRAQFCPSPRMVASARRASARSDPWSSDGLPKAWLACASMIERVGSGGIVTSLMLHVFPGWSCVPVPQTCDRAWRHRIPKVRGLGHTCPERSPCNFPRVALVCSPLLASMVPLFCPPFPWC